RRTCAQFGHTCQAGCQDTPTGFRCTCPRGYFLDEATGRRVCLEPCRPEDRNCNSTNGNSLKFIVINVLPKHNNFTLKIIDARHVNLTRHSTFAAAPAGVTIIRTPDPDLAGKLGRMFQMKIKAECYRGGDKPIFRTTFNVYISIAAYNYGMPTLQFLFPGSTDQFLNFS
uniref:EGF-like domain-containing protein n=1 Tax=Macrostomum lignano TaxID=282301 RepID=A0A1I8F3J2_9PLAT